MMIKRVNRNTLDDNIMIMTAKYLSAIHPYALILHTLQNDEQNRFISGHSPPRGMVRVPSTSNRAIILGFAGAIFAFY